MAPAGRIPGIVLTAIVALYCAASDAADFPSSNRVLVMYGNPDIGPWEQNFNAIVLRELATGAAIPVIPEFLSLIQTTEAEQRVLANALQLKHGDNEISLVIALGVEANSFAYDWHAVFAPGVPVLHVLPGTDVYPEPDEAYPRVFLESAVVEATRKTLEVIPQLTANLQALYVVGGAGDGDISYLNRIEDAVDAMQPEFPVTYLRGLPPGELIETLSAAPPASAVFLSTYDRDNNGTELRAMAVNNLIAESVALPIYAVFDTLLESGSLGGNMTASTFYANSTAEVAQDMIAGNFAAAPITASSSYMFNGSKLDEFGINRANLPPGSILVNDPPNFWRDYYVWVVGVVAIIVIQLALIGLLLESIRRRQAAESELEKVHKLEALGSLAGGIAHDFNNILMSIMANAELVSMKSGDPNYIGERVKNILSASERAKNLVSEILLFARQSEQQQFSTLDVARLVEESVGHIRSFLPSSCHIEYHCEENIRQINGDATQLHQVIMNLCVNAQHAMEEHGTIKVTAKNTVLNDPLRILNQQVPHGHYITIAITDTGMGISKDELLHVFEPFYTTKPHGKGTGLGLALVYRIVKDHRGYVDLQSTPGQGTTATVYIPIDSNEHIASAAPRELEVHRGNGEHILLVDDDEMVLDADKRCLENLGYRVSSHANPVEALEIFKANPQQYALIFTDLSMPGMDGVRLISSARELQPDIPVVLCTGYLSALEPVDLERVEILNKPSSYADISNAVSTALANR
jgi:signal transduction histidine kinase/ActR/RegA family two-component response regulator